MDTCIEWIISRGTNLGAQLSYVSQYKIDPSLIRSRPASSKAFSSACMHKHVVRPRPAPWPPLHLAPIILSKLICTEVGELLTTAFIAVFKVTWCAVVACAYDSLLANQDAADTPLHAVASLCSN